MLFSRRGVIKLASVAILSFKYQWAFSTTSQEDHKKALAVFVDTLLPRDESPSASDLLVDNKLLDKAASSIKYYRILMHGLKTLDQLAKESFGINFSALNLSQSTTIVEQLSLSNDQTASTFFWQARADVFEFYYTQPESYVGLGMNGPPQPLGFAGYSDPP